MKKILTILPLFLAMFSTHTEATWLSEITKKIQVTNIQTQKPITFPVAETVLTIKEDDKEISVDTSHIIVGNGAIFVDHHVPKELLSAIDIAAKFEGYGPNSSKDPVFVYYNVDIPGMEKIYMPEMAMARAQASDTHATLHINPSIMKLPEGLRTFIINHELTHCSYQHDLTLPFYSGKTYSEKHVACEREADVIAIERMKKARLHKQLQSLKKWVEQRADKINSDPELKENHKKRSEMGYLSCEEIVEMIHDDQTPIFTD